MPISDTGTATTGMNVARQFCRNRYTTRTTRIIASASVMITSSIDTFTKRVVSYTTDWTMPLGKLLLKLSTVRSTSSPTLSALAPGCRKIPTSVADLPLTRPMKS